MVCVVEWRHGRYPAARVLTRVALENATGAYLRSGVVNICTRIGCSNLASGRIWVGMASKAMEVTTQMLNLDFR